MKEKRPIIALDFPDKAAVFNFLGQFPADEKLFVKVGMELFFKEGPQMITELKKKNYDIFLDLKAHDIPNTVYKAMKSLAQLEINLTNVHAAGGEEMMKAALLGLSEGVKTPAKLLAVTQLTSTSEEKMQQEQLIKTSLENSVLNYAKLAQNAGLYGVVCSALEAKKIHEHTSFAFKCLTPGIRLEKNDLGDQKRVVTPRKAHELTSDFIVCGRPITQSPTPFASYLEIKNEWSALI